jgi:hypothetical protein
MKTKLKIILGALALCLAASTVTAQTSFTNGVKGSALPFAVTPLGGSEVMFLIQSNTTKQATVAQVTAAVTSGNLSTSNYFALVTSSNATALTAASNYLAAVTATNANNLVTVSNACATLALNASTKDTLTSNGIVALLPAYYPASNPSQYQSFSSVWSIANSAAASAVSTFQAVGVTNNGNATLENVNYVVIQNATPITSTFTVDLSVASLQYFLITNAVTLNFTNILAGQNVTLVFRNTDSSSRAITYPANAIRLVSGSTLSIGANKQGVINVTCIGTNILSTIVSGSSQQN